MTCVHCNGSFIEEQASLARGTTTLEQPGGRPLERTLQSIQSFELMLFELRLLQQTLERHDLGLRLALEVSEEERANATRPGQCG